MKILGSILAILMAFIGAIILIVDLLGGSGGAMLAALIALGFLSVQGILAIVSFFKPVGSGMGLMVTSGITLVIALISGGYATAFFEVMLLLSGLLLYKGGKKNDLNN